MPDYFPLRVPSGWTLAVREDGFNTWFEMMPVSGGGGHGYMLPTAHVRYAGRLMQRQLQAWIDEMTGTAGAVDPVVVTRRIDLNE